MDLRLPDISGVEATAMIRVRVPRRTNHHPDNICW